MIGIAAMPIRRPARVPDTSLVTSLAMPSPIRRPMRFLSLIAALQLAFQRSPPPRRHSDKDAWAGSSPRWTSIIRRQHSPRVGPGKGLGGCQVPTVLRRASSINRENEDEYRSTKR